MAGMHKWTVIYLMDCPGNTTTAAKAMFDDILSMNIPDAICISICLHIPVAAIKKVDPSYQGLVSDTSHEQTTLFYEIVRNPEGGSKLQLLREKRDFDITSQEEIKRFFQSILSGEQQAERYMLFTWGHGAAIGVFVSGSIQDNNAKMLDMVELKEAILHTFSRKLKLVIMVDCFMQYFDTGLLLRQAQVEYMVAAQYGITFFGYNYKKIFSTLYTSPGISSRDLARLSVTTLPDSPDMEDKLVCAAFFTTKLSLYDKLISIINKLGKQLSIEMDRRPGLIHAAIGEDNYLNGIGKLIDLFVVIDDIAARLGNNWESQTIKELHSLRKKMFIAKFTGPDISHPQPIIARGLSVSIPDTTDNFFYNTFVRCNPGSLSRIAGTCGEWTAFVEKYIAFANSRQLQPALVN